MLYIETKKINIIFLLKLNLLFMESMLNIWYIVNNKDLMNS